jgi:hypothetical protein
MTNENPVTDNQVTFTPQKYSPGALNIDLFAPHQSFYQSKEQPRYHYRVQSTGERGKYKGELILYDFRGGTGLTYGDFNRDFDRSAFTLDNVADTRFSRFLTLPMKTSTSATPDPAGTTIGMSHERFNFPSLISGGLVAYYDFEDASGNLLDNVGSNDLTETDGTIASVAGKVGNARDFERADTEYFAAADAAWNSITGNLTITAWINAETASGIFQGIVSKLTVAGDQVSYLLGINDLGEVTFEVSTDGTRTSSAVFEQVNSTPISASTWYFLVGRRREGVNVGLSVNAGTEVTATLAGGIFDGTAAFEIGAYNVNASNFDGIIDEVGVWNRVLTDDEVDWLYNSGSGRSYADITGFSGTSEPRTMIASGSNAGASLFYEGVAPEIVATPYNPGSAITALDAIVIGGATVSRKLLVSRAGGVSQLISEANGTVSVSGHADLNPAWGSCQTFLNNDTILHYADNGIYAHTKVQALSDAPTLTLSNLADGGYFLDNEPFRLGNSPYRCFLALPKQDAPTGMVPFGDTGDFEIVSINQEGFDPVPVNFPMLPKIVWAGRFRNGIVATDGLTIAYYDGETYFHTSPFGQRLTRDVDALSIVGAWVIGNDLYIRVSEALLNTTFNHVTMMWDFDTLAWNVTSIDSNDTSDGTPPRARGLPWSFNSSTSRYMYIYEAGSWKAQSWTYLEENPFFIQEDGSLLGAQEYEASAGVTSPYWELPGLEGKPKAITAITFMGDLVTGNASDNTTPTQVVVTAGGRTATFKSPADSDWIGTQRIEFKPDEVFDRLRMTITGTQGSGGTKPTYYTPNMLPVKIEFIAWEYPTPNIGQMLSLPLHK